MPYTYDYPHPAVTTDIVIFTILDDALQVLLIKRRDEPFKDQWALPGGFVDIDENLEDCALRELKEETGIKDVYLEQLYTYGDVKRDPRERVISVAYYALMPLKGQTIEAGDDAREAKWYPIEDLPTLAFDHDKVIAMAIERLSAKMDYSTIGLQFMPESFTLTELQRVYELAGQKTLDKRNFRKWIMSLNLVEETGEKRANGPYRPAHLFRVKEKSSVKVVR